MSMSMTMTKTQMRSNISFGSNPFPHGVIGMEWTSITTIT
eukprot:CAMPEP_0203653404 /NCGR_PEP_ID=MMETSP0088-20131115/32511_1 /ASSEMBLY_ACC=CAM_ASM_001087 /TAXON_ID=426623 /ORGANISM="Chaetoceros affinis, Strain CCMP159" /LENGTH=39 /DNA_ID= /DNA_START= /DNA_END= /DNA_ORIENTATION=